MKTHPQLNIKRALTWASLFTLLFFNSSFAFDQIKVTTWNIEHLGTDGRGFGGGYGGGSLDLRTDDQLKKIGIFIRDTLRSDVIALQEIAISSESLGVSKSTELKKITDAMGANWAYYLPPIKRGHNEESMYVGFLWNKDKINAIKIKSLFVPELHLGGKPLFKRTPVVGYFEIIENGQSRNDFLLVNVHLASGQTNFANHLIAMTIIEYRLNAFLKTIGVTESDRIILGDFNDNPYAKKGNGLDKHSKALYHHMKFEGYSDMVTEDFHSTRMDHNLTSIIDHILVNKSAKRHVVQESKAKIWLPDNAPGSFADWRQTYSDHFPISIDIKVQNDDDKDWNEGS